MGGGRSKMGSTKRFDGNRPPDPFREGVPRPGRERGVLAGTFFDTKLHSAGANQQKIPPLFPPACSRG